MAWIYRQADGGGIMGRPKGQTLCESCHKKTESYGKHSMKEAI